jgi:hypothetical protein
LYSGRSPFESRLEIWPSYQASSGFIQSLDRRSNRPRPLPSEYSPIYIYIYIYVEWILSASFNEPQLGREFFDSTVRILRTFANFLSTQVLIAMGFCTSFSGFVLPSDESCCCLTL